MNIFQKQLLINGASLASLPDLEGKQRDYGRIEPPAKISAEEFERTMADIREDTRRFLDRKYRKDRR